MFMRDNDIERVNTMKFLGVLSWKEHIQYLENKIAKTIALYYSYIDSYLNYANLAWDSTYLTNLKKLCSQQKHTIRIVNNKTKFKHTKELFKSANVLNLYKLNILSMAVFM